MIEALKKYPNYKSGENKIEEDKTSDGSGAPLVKVSIEDEAGFNNDGAVKGTAPTNETDETDSAGSVFEAELNSEADKNMCAPHNDERVKAENENESVQTENVVGTEGGSAGENEEPEHEDGPRKKSKENEEESALPLICKYDTSLIKRIKKTINVKRKVKNVHGITVLTPLAMKELLEKQDNVKISGKINCKQRFPKDMLPVSEIKLPGGRWSVVGAECEVPGEIRGYIPVDETRYIAVYDAINLFDKLFPIVFVGTLIWLLVSGYLQGREAVHMIGY